MRTCPDSLAQFLYSCHSDPYLHCSCIHYFSREVTIMKKASQLKAEARASLAGKGMRLTTLLYWLAIFGIGILTVIVMVILMHILQGVGILIAILLYFALLFFMLALFYKYNAACLDISHGGYKTFKDIFDFSGHDSIVRSFLGLFIPGLIVFLLACATIIPCTFIFSNCIQSNLAIFSTNALDQAGSMIQFTIISLLFLMVLMIPSLIYYYACSLTPFLAHDNPQSGIVECVKKSIVMMKGNKLRLMWLDITFIGWILLIWLTSSACIAIMQLGIAGMVLGVILYLVAYFGILCHVFPYWTTSRAHFYKDLMDANNVVQDVLDDPENPEDEDLDKIINSHK